MRNRGRVLCGIADVPSRQVLFYSRKQQRSKSTVIGVCIGKHIALQNRSQKLLDDILGVFGSLPVSTQPNERRLPIAEAQFLECFARLWIVSACSHDYRPGRGREASVVISFGKVQVLVTIP